MWDLIVSFPDHCFSFYFSFRITLFLPPLGKTPDTNMFLVLEPIDVRSDWYLCLNVV